MWECLPLADREIDPTRLTRMALVLLGCDDRDDSLIRRTTLTVKATVGRALRQRGMQVCLVMTEPDQDVYELSADIAAVNPARPDRGRVRIDDFGVLRWICELDAAGKAGLGLDPADEDEGGLDPAEIGRSMGGRLTAAAGN
jgi:hypothetical protein